jgi:hypothetical protein
MRYYFFTLGLVSLLAACGEDPTGPVTGPRVDAGRHLPKREGPDPILCLKRRAPAIESQQSHLVCRAK